MKDLAPQEAKVRKLLTAGMSIKEVAEVMGITLNNVHQILFRLRKKENALAARTVDSTTSPQAGDI